MSDSSPDESEDGPIQAAEQQGDDDITFQKLVSILTIRLNIFLFVEVKTLFDCQCFCLILQNSIPLFNDMWNSGFLSK